MLDIEWNKYINETFNVVRSANMGNKSELIPLWNYRANLDLSSRRSTFNPAICLEVEEFYLRISHAVPIIATHRNFNIVV